MNILSRPGRWWRAWKASRAVANWRRAHTGPGSRLARTVQVYGWKNVRIGRNTMICDDVLLNAINHPQAEPAIIIGDHCFLGRRIYLNAGTRLVIGDYCLIGPDCQILGADHDHADPLTPYVVGGSKCGEIVIGPNCWLGTHVAVLRGVTIGYGSVVGAMAVVTSSVPPLSVAVGNPARVIKRFDVERRVWVPAAEFSREAADRTPEEVDYLSALRRENATPRMPMEGIGLEIGDC